MVSSGGYCACRICRITGIYYHNSIPNPRTGVVSGGHTYFPLKLPDDYVFPAKAPLRADILKPDDLKLRTDAEFKDAWERLQALGLLKKDAKAITQETGKRFN
jgi:hypothetical protein